MFCSGYSLGICQVDIHDGKIFWKSEDLSVCFYDVNLHRLLWTIPSFCWFYSIFALGVSLHVATALKQQLLWCLIALTFLCAGQKHEAPLHETESVGEEQGKL